MVIYELEYEEGKPSNFQDRYIVAPSFDAYKKCLFGEIKHMPDIGFFGSHTDYEIIDQSDDFLAIRFAFPMSALPNDFMHVARAVDERIDILNVLE